MLGLRKRKREVTLVLGGGSARGMAHIGVLKVFEREKIPVDRIVGTSIGALVGAAYALGITPEEMEERTKKFDLKRLLDPTMPKMGLLAGERLEGMIREITHGKRFEDCRIPFIAVTTDIETGEEIAYQKGDLQKIIRASCSWPGVFNPVRIDGRLLADGGIKNSVPTKIAKSFGADYMIAVNVGFCVRKGRIDNIFQMILQSFQIMGHELNAYQAQEGDTVIEVELDDLDQFAFHRAGEAIIKGFAAAEKAVDKLKLDLGLSEHPIRDFIKRKRGR